MAKLRDYRRDHPVYSEGPRSYSPHWARALLKPRTQKRQQPLNCWSCFRFRQDCK